MFDPKSRYASIDVATLSVTGADGQPRLVGYVKRRFIPDDAGVVLVSHTVKKGERLDRISTRYLGDPLQFYRICDANGVLRPTELTDETGRSIAIAMPSLTGR